MGADERNLDLDAALMPQQSLSREQKKKTSWKYVVSEVRENLSCPGVRDSKSNRPNQLSFYP
jgi:hypothetical protein